MESANETVKFSNEVPEQINLLDLPNEILLHVFSFITKMSDHLLLSTTCKRFHELSCETIECKLAIESKVASKKVFNNIVNSNRRVSKLELDLNLKNASEHEISVFANKLRRILRHHAENITDLKIKGTLTMDMISTLNLLPNLKILRLLYLKGLNVSVPENFLLNLKQLKELYIFFGFEQLNEILERLPENVLTKVYFFMMGSPSVSFLNKQRNIKKLMAAQKVDLKNLKLEAFNAHHEHDYGGQEELKVLTRNELVTNSEFRNMSKHLKSLEELVLQTITDDVDCSLLTKFKHLKTFQVSVSREDLFLSMKSNTVTDLMLALRNVDLKEANVREVARNFPKVTSLYLDKFRPPFPDVKTILEQMPKLECLICVFFEGTPFVDGLEHKNLKHLVIKANSIGVSISELVKKCENLEVLDVHLLNQKICVNELLGVVNGHLPYIAGASKCDNENVPPGSETQLMHVILKKNKSVRDCYHGYTFDRSNIISEI